MPGIPDRRAPPPKLGEAEQKELRERAATQVRLARHVEDLAAGTEGGVVGAYRREPPTYLVTFEDGQQRALAAYDLELIESTEEQKHNRFREDSSR
jgi:hypothetical protein